MMAITTRSSTSVKPRLSRQLLIELTSHKKARTEQKGKLPEGSVQRSYFFLGGYFGGFLFSTSKLNSFFPPSSMVIVWLGPSQSGGETWFGSAEISSVQSGSTRSIITPYSPGESPLSLWICHLPSTIAAEENVFLLVRGAMVITSFLGRFSVVGHHPVHALSVKRILRLAADDHRKKNRDRYEAS